MRFQIVLPRRTAAKTPRGVLGHELYIYKSALGSTLTVSRFLVPAYPLAYVNRLLR